MPEPVSLLVSQTVARTHQDRFQHLSLVGRGLELRIRTGANSTDDPADSGTDDRTDNAPDGRIDDPTDAEAAFLSPDEYPNPTARLMATALKAPSLRWFHTMSAGVDHPVFTSLLDRGVRLTTSSGAAAVPIAHAVLMHMLALSRRLPAMMRNQETATWDRLPGSDLAGATLVIAGMGPIGLEVARLAKAFRMRAIGLRRTVAGTEPCETWSLSRLSEALKMADYVVLALPLTTETRHLLNATSFAVLRKGAILVNVGRGGLIDESALIDALQSGHLAGAGLDVTEVEPLPSSSPLWTMANVVLTPHNSAAVPSTNAAVMEIFFDNLGRYLRGEPLLNEVFK